MIEDCKFELDSTKICYSKYNIFIKLLEIYYENKVQGIQYATFCDIHKKIKMIFKASKLQKVTNLNGNALQYTCTLAQYVKFKKEFNCQVLPKESLQERRARLI